MAKQRNDATYSIIVPAYKEAKNITPLTERIFKALKGRGMDQKTEIIVVDDNSQDGTTEVVAALSKAGYSISVIVRTQERGLSSAVLAGFKAAHGSVLICMDADLQHPPESVPELINSINKGNEFVIGTRYGKSGFDVDENWPMHRQVISKGARLLARPLTPLSDPMTGFFGVSKEIYQNCASSVSPLGFKIALELFVKANIQKSDEVPIKFGVRTEGESKLSSKVMINYLVHLYQLYTFKFPTLLPFVIALVIVTCAVIIFAFSS
eukprot:TRINITY_DN10662_c0_g1_i1.p1 TRINITY_DN10662_c0_g1~~TRINITY_DN10662_c0_g1_i1.p1  ORF type:complete len:284 (+),score=31.10 TRINITY_DN10662_c0_g1_i1:55-852(+)